MGALHIASSAGDVSEIRRALEAGEEVDSLCARWMTALMHASCGGHVDAVQVLLKAGAALGLVSHEGRTALMLASVLGHENVVRALLEAGAAVDQPDNGLYTALMHASIKGHTGVVQVLLEAGARVDCNDRNEETALMYAGRNGHESTMRVLLAAGAAADSKDNFDKTVLMHTCEGGHTGGVQVLLEAGARVDCNDHKDSKTALMYAGVNGHESTLRVLLAAGAAVDSKDRLERTALMHTCSEGHTGAAVRVLLKAGAEVELHDHTGATALMVASQVGHVIAVRMLLLAGAAVDRSNAVQKTSLMRASAAGHDETVRALLEAGPAVDSIDIDRLTALMQASANGHTGAVRALLEAGAAVDSINIDRQTALMQASANGHTGAVRALLEAGAALELKDAGYATALAVAIRRVHLDVARVLLEAGAELTSRMLPFKSLGPAGFKMQKLLAHHRDERQARVVEADRADRETAVEAAADALLAEEEAEKSSAELRQAKAKRKKQRQKTKRAEAVPGPAQAGGASSGPALSGAACFATAVAPTAGVEEGQRAAAEQGSEGTEGGVPAGTVRPASHAPDGADGRGGAGEERDAAILTSPFIISVSADEVLRAFEAAGSDGEVGEGGFGKVVAAELPSLVARWGRVAVKCASGVHAADILKEVATLRLCSHRNVLALLGYCDDARAPCMVTPLMHGGSLDDRPLLSAGAFERLRWLGFEGDTCLGWQQRLSALCDAARGLAHLHGKRILHRDVKTANILLEGALEPLPMAHGPPLLVFRAVLSDVGLAKVREPTLGGGTTHATTRNLAFSMGFVDPSLVNSNQHSEKTDAFGIGVCILMGLVSEPAAGLLKDHEKDVFEAFEDGTGPLFGAAHAVAGWPSDATRALAEVVHGLSMERNWKRQPLLEALAQMEALLGAVGEVASGEAAMAQPAPAVVGAASSRPFASPRGASMPPVPEDEPDARAAASAQPEVWSGGELTRMVRQLEVGDADAPLARKRERVTKAYDSMMVRLERVYAAQGHAPLPAGEQELRKIDLLAPRHLGRLNGLAHTLRKWWNAAKHQRDQWVHSPSDKEVQRLVREVVKELDGLGW